ERSALQASNLGPGVVAVFATPEWAPTLELALGLHPDTRQVLVVHGSAPLDRSWEALARRDLAAYEQRVEVRHLARLPLDRLLEEVARLPEGTVILIGSVLSDGEGRSVGAISAVERMSQVSPRPIYGLFEPLLGHGIVGGRLLAPRAHGEKAAELALRILGGESLAPGDSADNVGSAYMFDARQLARLGIPETTLPAGSVVRFREPSLWNLYGWPFIAGLWVVAVETALIAGLLIERRRRHTAQRALAARLHFEHLLADLTATFARVRPADVEPAIDVALAMVVDVLDVDRAALAEFAPDGRSIRLTHRQRRPGVAPISSNITIQQYPWTVARMLRGECVTFARVDDLPAEADTDRHMFRAIGTRSFASVPLRVTGRIVGALRVATTRSERVWSAEFLQQLELLSEILGNALASNRAEADRREQENRFRTMADAAPVMIWMSGIDAKRDFFNKRWLEFTGRPLEDERGTGWIGGVHHDDVEQCLDAYVAACNERRNFRLEYRLKRHDGEYRSILDTGVARRTADDVFVGYVGSSVDVTEIRAAHRAVLDSSALSAAMLESLHGRVAALDARGVIVAVNQAWTNAAKDIAGLARTAVGDNYLDVCRSAAGDADGERARAAIEDVLAGRLASARVEYACPGFADARWFEMIAEPLKRPKGGVLISHVDITERRRVEEEARLQRDELARALRLTTMGELAASLSHEMNQPLTAILTSAQAARRVLDTPDPERREIIRAAVDYIIEDSKRAAQVIRRLRALFSKEHGERKPIDINEIIMDVVGLVRGDSVRRRVAMRFELAEGLPVISGDVVQLQQVMLNLIMNAMEATALADEPREVVITTLQAEPGLLRLSVRDSGIGVEAAQLEKIFEPFVSTKSDGLGMGLSISRSIVQAHGGRIWATRNADRGLTVQVEVPCEEQV
ncbi:MAG TPA: ATP-binding protein, partial [Methylomirabilota bacterium]